MKDEVQAADFPEVQRLELHSEDIAASRRAELLRLFPEAAGEAGLVDLDQLKRALGEAVEPGKERFGMTWPGKADCFRTIQTPSTATLLPVADDSVEFDATNNVLIEGDNLEVLKLLQKAYLGRVKMIYIDPPYNTGNDFIYPDDFAESLQTYLAYTGQVDVQGRRFSTNPETSGRFHSNWLNMIYPRLYLARNLLREDGVVFVSIDDHEVARLRVVMDELFGEDNMLATFVWKRKAGGGDDSGHVAAEHEYILCYARDESKCQLSSVLHESPAMTAKYNRKENGRRYYLERLDKTSLTYNASMDFEIECPDGTRIKPPQPNPATPTTIWRWGSQTVIDRRDELIFLKEGKTGAWRTYTKTWESLEGVTPRSLLVDQEHGRNRDGTRELSDLIGPKVFDNPKPLRLLRHLLSIGASEPDALVLDFFAGSGSLGHAVLEANRADDGQRSFILVQLPEPTGRNDHKTLVEVCAFRLRRAIEELGKDRQADLLQSSSRGSGSLGFRFFRLAESNFAVWDAARPEDEAALAQQLHAHIEHIRPGRSEADLLFEVLLKSGFPLDAPVAELELKGAHGWSVAEGALVVFLHRPATLEQVRGIAMAEPVRVVMLDEAFAGNDQLKANAAQIFKSKNIAFKTV